ncbi:hypothetical protein NDU88_009051 [Pleurodeles waltl]|uniref:Uncharacterized protein n=1 Tax=Pleurodeles waltl TaxID=8319 RepID=A0AAV7QWH3_PLEWA|nr:hypothetical protein NDU88_009051 [Pleurodeles waltl]
MCRLRESPSSAHSLHVTVPNAHVFQTRCGLGPQAQLVASVQLNLTACLQNDTPSEAESSDPARGLHVTASDPHSPLEDKRIRGRYLTSRQPEQFLRPAI